MQKQIAKLVAACLILNLSPVSGGRPLPARAARAGEPSVFQESAIPPRMLLQRLAPRSLTKSFKIRLQAAVLGGFVILALPPDALAQKNASKKHVSPVEAAETSRKNLMEALTQLDKDYTAFQATLRDTAAAIGKTLPTSGEAQNETLTDPQRQALERIAATLVISGSLDPTIEKVKGPEWLTGVIADEKTVQAKQTTLQTAIRAAESAGKALPVKSRDLANQLAKVEQVANKRLQDEKQAMAFLTLTPGAESRTIYHSDLVWVRAGYATGGKATIEQVAAKASQNITPSGKESIDFVLVRTPYEYDLLQMTVKIGQATRQKIASFESLGALQAYIATFNIEQTEVKPGAPVTASTSKTAERSVSVTSPAAVIYEALLDVLYPPGSMIPVADRDAAQAESLKAEEALRKKYPEASNLAGEVQAALSPANREMLYTQVTAAINDGARTVSKLTAASLVIVRVVEEKVTPAPVAKQVSPLPAKEAKKSSKTEKPAKLVKEPPSPLPAPKPIPLKADPAALKSIGEINDILKKSVDPWLKKLSTSGLAAGPASADAEAKLNSAYSDLSSNAGNGPEKATRDKALKEAGIAKNQIAAISALLALDAEVKKAEAVETFQAEADAIKKGAPIPWIDANLTPGTRQEVFYAATALAASKNKTLAALLSDSYAKMTLFAQNNPALQSAVNQALGLNLGDKSNDFKRLATQLQARAENLYKQPGTIPAVGSIRDGYTVIEHEREIVEVALPKSTDHVDPNGLLIKVFRLVDTTPDDRVEISWKVYIPYPKDSHLQVDAAGESITGERHQSFGNIVFQRSVTMPSAPPVPISHEGRRQPTTPPGDIPHRLAIAAMVPGLLFFRAKRLASRLHEEPLQQFSVPGTPREMWAAARLMNFPMTPLLAEFRRLPSDDPNYPLIVKALSANYNLTLYPAVQSLYRSEADSRKKKDLAGILLHLQYNAILVSHVNRRTWEDRYADLWPRLIHLVSQLQELYPRGILIQDWGVSTGITTWQLAEKLKEYGLLGKTKIEAYDRVTSFRYLSTNKGTYFFNSEGQLIQKVGTDNSLWVRWTLAGYFPWLIRAIFHGFIRLAGGVRVGEWGHEAEIRYAEAHLFAHSIPISLLHPEAEAWAERYPKHLQFLEGDLRHPPAHQAHLILLLGLAMRAETISFRELRQVWRTGGLSLTRLVKLWRKTGSYFKNHEIKNILTQMGGRLYEEGSLINGIVVPPYTYLDIYLKSKGELIRNPAWSEGYGNSREWQRFQIAQAA